MHRLRRLHPTIRELRTNKSLLVHSMVSSMRLRWTGSDGSQIDEDVVLPPVKVANTTAVVLLAGLLKNLERHVMGGCLKDWLQLLSTCFTVGLFVIISDGASANLKLLKLLVIVLFHFAALTGLRVCFWWQKCLLHQMGRASVGVLNAFNLVAPVYSMTKIVKMQRVRREAAKAAKKIIKTSLLWHDHTPKPRTYVSSDAFRKDLLDLLTTPYVQADLEDSIAEPADPSITTTSRTIGDNLKAALGFYNGDITAGTDKVEHYCDNCCSSKTEAITKAQNLYCDVAFAHSTPDFEPARWLFIIMGLQYWTALLIFNGIGTWMFHPTYKRLSAQSENLRATDPNKGVKEFLGKRVGRGWQLLSKPNVVFHLLLVLRLLQWMERVVYLLFSMSDVTINKAKSASTSLQSREYKRRKLAHEKQTRKARQGSAGASDQVTSGTAKKGFRPFMVAIEDLLEKLWGLLSSDPNSGLLRVITVWWKNGSKSDMLVQLRKAILSLAAQLYIRFYIMHEAYPYCLAWSLEEDGLTRPEAIIKAKPEVINLCRTKPRCCHEKLWTLQQINMMDDIDGDDHKAEHLVEQYDELIHQSRATSLREEHYHAFQKRAAGGVVSWPLSFARQVAASVIQVLARVFHALGGRDLSKAPTWVTAQVKVATGAVHTVFRRPKQLGRALFSYVAEAVKKDHSDDTYQQKRQRAVQTYNNMSPYERKQADAAHIVKVNRKRIRPQQQTDSSGGSGANGGIDEPRTPWNAGDKTWPFNLSEVTSFVDKFSTSESGRVFMKELEVEEKIIEKLTQAPWHSTEAAAKAAMSFLKIEMDEEKAQENETLKEALRLAGTAEGKQVIAKGCHLEHYGLCVKDNASIFTEAMELARLLVSLGKCSEQEHRWEKVFRLSCKGAGRRPAKAIFVAHAGGMLNPAQHVFIMCNVPSLQALNDGPKMFIYKQQSIRLPVEIKLTSTTTARNKTIPNLMLQHELSREMALCCKKVSDWSIDEMESVHVNLATVMEVNSLDDGSWIHSGQVAETKCAPSEEPPEVNAISKIFDETFGKAKADTMSELLLKLLGPLPDEDFGGNDMDDVLDDDTADMALAEKMLEKLYGCGGVEADMITAAAGGHLGDPDVDDPPDGPAGSLEHVCPKACESAGTAHPNRPTTYKKQEQLELIRSALGSAEYDAMQQLKIKLNWNDNHKCWQASFNNKYLTGTNTMFSKHGNHAGAIYESYSAAKTKLQGPSGSSSSSSSARVG